jgi:NADH dehydrogenase
VVIVGAGFAGLHAALGLEKVAVDMTVIDRRNHHLFQPLLYQVATAALSPADIATPIRAILSRLPNATVMLGEVGGVDAEARHVLVGDRRISYDWLIVATGARHAYFGHDEWEPWAPGLKSVEDATAIRRRILTAFELAEHEADPEHRRRLLTFVVVGGGPTGVELAGTLAELARHALARDFRNIDPRCARVVLVEATDRLLRAFPADLSAAAHRALSRLGVEIRLNAPVTDCDAKGVGLQDGRIESATVLWAAGVMASPAAHWLGVSTDAAGRLIVEPDLSVPGHPEIFAIGDTALVRDAAGVPVPGIAPAAKQQGAYAAALIAARVADRPAPRPFRYRHLGNLATIGRAAAVADFGWLRLRGRIAWLLWGAVHLLFLIGGRNRVTVLTDWLWSYVTYGRGARLITGSMM